MSTASLYYIHTYYHWIVAEFSSSSSNLGGKKIIVEAVELTKPQRRGGLLLLRSFRKGSKIGSMEWRLWLPSMPVLPLWVVTTLLLSIQPWYCCFTFTQHNSKWSMKLESVLEPCSTLAQIPLVTSAAQKNQVQKIALHLSVVYKVKQLCPWVCNTARPK